MEHKNEVPDMRTYSLQIVVFVTVSWRKEAGPNQLQRPFQV